jgi:hypothetical protein
MDSHIQIRPKIEAFIKGVFLVFEGDDLLLQKFTSGI